MIKQVKIDIEISDFFELNRFQPEEKENDNLLLKLKSSTVLLSGEMEEELAGLCKNGGMNKKNNYFDF